MASTSLILALTVLTATIFVLLILWIFIRYTKERRLQRTQHCVHQDAEFASGNGESQVHLAQQEHCQPSEVEHEETPGVKSQKSNKGAGGMNSGENAENSLKKGTSKDDMRGAEEAEASRTNTAKIWGGEGDAMAWNMSTSRTGHGAESAERAR